MCEAIFAILHSWPVWFGVRPWEAPSHRWGSFMSDIISTIVDLGTSDDEDGHKWSRFIMIRDTLLCCYIILPPLNYNSVFLSWQVRFDDIQPWAMSSVGYEAKQWNPRLKPMWAMEEGIWVLQFNCQFAKIQILSFMNTYINTQNKISFVSHGEGNLSPLIVHFNILSVQSTQRIKKKSLHGIPGPGWIKRTIKLVSELLMRCWCIYSIRNNQVKSL